MNNLSSGLLFCIFLAFLTISSCKNDPEPIRSTSNIRMMDEKVIGYNRGVIRNEDQEIRDFLTRYRWDLTVTPTGLRYFIYHFGDGRKSEKGLTALFGFELRLLNGKLIYSSDSAGQKKIVLGHGEVEVGLEEGLLLLHQGDKAKFIIPSHLAYGLLGDQKQIPPGATLVYDVELIQLNKPDRNVHN